MKFTLRELPELRVLGFSSLLVLLFTACDHLPGTDKAVSYEIPELYAAEEEQALIDSSAVDPRPRMRFKRIQSPHKSKSEIYSVFYNEVAAFPEARYAEMRPWVLGRDIPEIQEYIAEGKFTYEELVLWYLKRIYSYELDKETGLQTILSLNPSVLDEARGLDASQGSHHPIYGMPILLKDNIGAEGMPTTAGAVAFKDNMAGDAFIVQRLKEKGALVLGKVNLSEWANFLCSCPNGQSAMGGQTLNPYGRFKFDTGGSSSGSGTSMAANYAAAAVGTETSGSILSPSSSNSIVGMKPTVGLLSRSGIVPISSTLDTPGPMTRSIIDNAILLDAMRGYDEGDGASVKTSWEGEWYKPDGDYSIKGKRLGFFGPRLERDSLYRASSEALAAEGAVIVEIDPEEAELEGFLSLLNADMKFDMPEYIRLHSKLPDSLELGTMDDLHAFNLRDSTARIPYGQIRFDGVVQDTTSRAELQALGKRLQQQARDYFGQAFALDLDAVVSINNSGAGYAAAAKYPALTIPMGYRNNGQPAGITLIGKQFQEGKLYHLGFEVERILDARSIPQGYEQ